MNTVGDKFHTEYSNPWYENEPPNPSGVPPNSNLKVYREYGTKRRPDWVELTVFALISGLRDYKIVDYVRAGDWTHTDSDGVKTVTWRPAEKGTTERSYARCRFDYEIPMEDWDSMNNEEAEAWIKRQIQRDLEHNDLYGYWIEKRD